MNGVGSHSSVRLRPPFGAPSLSFARLVPHHAFLPESALDAEERDRRVEVQIPEAKALELSRREPSACEPDEVLGATNLGHALADDELRAVSDLDVRLPRRVRSGARRWDLDPAPIRGQSFYAARFSVLISRLNCISKSTGLMYPMVEW